MGSRLIKNKKIRRMLANHIRRQRQVTARAGTRWLTGGKNTTKKLAIAHMRGEDWSG